MTAAGQGPFEGRAGRVEQQLTRLGHAAADHEAGRIEHRGQVGQALAEPAAHDLEAAQRGRVAFGRGLGDLRAGNALGYSPAQLEQPHGALRGAPGELARLGDQGVAAGVLLPAAPVPAAAQPPVGDHPDVAGLAGDAPAAAVQLAADDDGGPDPGPDRHQHHVAVAAGGTEPRLGPGRGVRVVLHHDRAAEALLHPLLERLVAPGQVRREQHGGARAVDEPGGTEADGGDLVAASSSVTTSAIACSVSAGLAAGVDLFSFAMIRPFSSTTPAATLVPPTSTPMARVRAVSVVSGGVEPGRVVERRSVRQIDFDLGFS